MRRGCVLALLSCLCAWGLAGCGTPGWVQDPPSSSSYIYAVGRWPKTRYANQRLQAGNEARAELARVVHVHVDETMTMYRTKYGARTTEKMRQILSNTTDADLQGVEVVSYWTDRSGRLGAPDTMYALARISRADAAAAIQRVASRRMTEQEEAALKGLLEEMGGGSP